MFVSQPQSTTIQLCAYSAPQLARLYQISARTFKKWIKPFAAEIGPLNGRLFNVNQVKVIFSKLGMPETMQAEPDTTEQNLEKFRIPRHKRS